MRDVPQVDNEYPVMGVGLCRNTPSKTSTSSESRTVGPSQKVSLTIEGEGKPGHGRCGQEFLHSVPGVNAAAILVQHREVVFIEQEDLVGLLIDLVYHRTLKDGHTEVKILTQITLGQERRALTFLWPPSAPK